MTNPTNPGWYDDPESPDQLRYFDGIVWSRHTTPRAGLPIAPADTSGAAARTAGDGTPLGAPHAQPGAGGRWPGQSGGGQQWPGQGTHGNDGRSGWPGSGGAGQSGQSGQRPAGPTTRDGVPLASYGQRVGAFFIDGLIKIALNLILGGYPFYRAFQTYFDQAYAAAKAGRTSSMAVDLSQLHVGWLTAYVLITSLIGIVYSVLFNVRRGATPGKSALGISVRLVDHPGPLDVTTAVRRAAIPFLVAVTSFLPVISTLSVCLWVVDHLLPAAQPRRQALHDLLAGTQVVRGSQPPRR